MKKLLSLLLVAVMMGALLTACGNQAADPTPTPAGDPTPTASTEPSQDPATTFDLNVCFASEPQSIDPALNSAVDGAVMIQHMFEGLMKWESNGAQINDSCAGASLVPGQAAAEPEKVTNADGTVTYTFKLRDDIKWSDGKDVTAQDFVYSWQRLATPATAADYNYMIDCVVGYDAVANGTPTGQFETVKDEETGEDVQKEIMEYADPSTLGIVALDDKTVQITITNDLPYFLEICAFPATYPVRQDIVEANPDQWTFDVNSYISNGAYKMSDWTHNAKIVMVKNDQYYDYANLGPDSITFTLMDDNNAMLSAFKSGELDYIQDMPVDEIAGLLADGKMEIMPYIGDYYVCFQNQKAPFDDPRVRKAFSLTIDRNYIVEQVTQTGQVPATGYVPSGINDAAGDSGADFRTVGGDYWDASKEAYEANCEEARALLAEAGYPNGEGFPVVEYLYNTSDAHKAVGEALQFMWEQELGVTVTLNNQEWGTFLETRKQGDYSIARNGWIADYNDPMSFLDMWLTGGGNNDAKYEVAAYDEIIKQAKASSDYAERMKLMHQAEDMLIGQDSALAPIYFYTQKYMIADDVNGMFYTPLGFFFFMYATQG